MKRSSVSVLAACLLAACGPAPDALPERRTPRPSPPAAPWPEAPAPGFARDVVLVTIDTLRADATGFAGNPRAETPHLDRLAASGWVFERAHAHSVMTLPSHASLLTGQLPYEHGVRDNAGFVLPRSVRTGAEAFADAGFRTAAFVAAFPLDARYGLDRGFEVYDDAVPPGAARRFAVAERSGAEVVAAASAWWRSNESARRFLWVHLYEPHVPYEPPAPFSARFADSSYLGEVAAADEYVGRLLAEVESSSSGDSLVVVTSDHGEGLGDHGERTHGLFAYESTLAVPLLFWSPALDGARIAAPVRLVDVAPTLLQAAGIELSMLPRLSGRSLWRPSDGASRGTGEPATTYFEALRTNLQRGWAPLRGVIAVEPAEPRGGAKPEGPFKYISLPIPELYDLASDPNETRNLHRTRPDTASRLAALLPVESQWPPTAGAVTEEERRALESLGYLTASGGRGGPPSYGEQDDPKVLVDLDRMIQDWSEAYLGGRFEQAEQLARRMIERRPRMGLGHLNLAQVLLDRGRTEEALRVMVDAERAGIASPFLRRQLALTLAEVGRAEDAVRLMERHASSRDPDNLNVLGLVLSEAGRPDRARDILLRSLEIDGRDPRARQNLALAALHQADWPLCEREARSALALDPVLPLAWNYLGIALFNQRRADEAIQAWQRSVELDPGDLDVLFNLASVAARSGRRDVARPALERYVEAASAPSFGDRFAADLEVARSLLRGL